MNQQTHCVYNQTRECFLSLNVSLANTIFSRLKGLIGRFKLKADEGLWMVPSHGIHTFGVFVSLDLIYLDENDRVIYLFEHFPKFSVSPFKTQSASVLQLPTHSIYSSQTQVGDQLWIGTAQDIEHRFIRETSAPLGVPTESMAHAVRTG